jgi:cytochrome c oxidase subunit 1
VYVIFLPAVGILFEIVATMGKNRVFNYKAAVYGGVCGMVALSGEVWVHHLYVAGMPDWIRVGMMVSTLLISVPVGLVVMSLWGTLYKASISFNIGMYYATSCLFLLLIGGLTGIPLAMTSMTVHLSETSFVHAHFHFVMALFATFSIFAGIYYWFPKMTGRLADSKLGYAAFWLNTLGVNLTFWPLFVIGLEGMPRRYWDYSEFPSYFAQYHHVATYGAILTALGTGLTIINLVYAAFAGKKAGNNPWKSKSLEWTHTVSPPGPGNFLEDPVVEPGWTPYDYAK